ncbi:MAG: hypothetical protein GKR89_01290 [Candidatus Latescibacteria bacterium]|nr:hypothetical protein [Candidatus Latescibacterota bacterium]
MREFIVWARKGPTHADFDLDDLGRQGWLGNIAQCMVNALYYSNRVRQDTVLHLVLEGPPLPPRTVRLAGAALEALTAFDDRSVCTMVQRALAAGVGLRGAGEIEVERGLFVGRKGLVPLAEEKAAAGPLYIMRPEGVDIRTMAAPPGGTFLLTDQLAMPPKTRRYLTRRLGARPLSLGPRTLFAAHCIVLVHNELDRWEGS